MNHNEVAKTILDQLGGKQFAFMTGAKGFIASPVGAGQLSFSLPGAGFTKNGINRVSITLNFLDLYDIVFSRVRGVLTTVVESHSGIYAEDLCKLFTEATGLDVRL